ncbi:hypothetical protein [Deinococcus sp.]|uniref:hypothetical protein n=1 Tax=Deinococcus sp. TaxID=47478 RepID=UPI00286990B8|nr:hypothetical protein [Deinococcus sp.]
MNSTAEFLGVLGGAALAVLTVTWSAALRPRPAQVTALLGLVALGVLAGMAVLTGDTMARSFGVVYLMVGAVCALGLALPRWLRWTGLERLWVPPGMGAFTLLALIAVGMGADALLTALLAPDTKAASSSGLVNGLFIGALGTVLAHVVGSLRPRTRRS